MIMFNPILIELLNDGLACGVIANAGDEKGWSVIELDGNRDNEGKSM